jgi:nanoRNase/pAp phosphatase (c-di-AMP/oligoRNAs hydrolase)
VEVSAPMDQPFPKSVSYTEKVKRLLEVVSSEDFLAVLINADPDSMASAIALKRLFWRRVKKTAIYHINTIKRADNLAMIRLLGIDQKPVKQIHKTGITKWAILDSQPQHDEQFEKYSYDIIIDHHPFIPGTSAQFLDVKEDYGANATILTEYLRAAKIKPSPRLATALFYGIKTDTDNFARNSSPSDINAFRYLYEYANLHIIKKIESSEMTKATLKNFKQAIENLVFWKDVAYIHMGKVANPDVLVMVTDFFLKMAEAAWCIVSGVYGQKLIIIFRNAGFRLDAGKKARKLFGPWGAAGGHKNAARAEIPIKNIPVDSENQEDIQSFVLKRIKGLREKK